MHYDFTKLQQALAERGWTLTQLAARTAGKVHYSTISKAFGRGTAHQSTATALCKALRVSMKDIMSTNGKKTA